MLKPDLEQFLHYAGSGDLVPVWKEFLFDADTAVTAFAKLARPPFAFLLESVVGGEKWARYTFLGTAPRSAWRLSADGHTSTWTQQGGWTEPARPADPLAELDALLRKHTLVDVPGLPRLVGGAVGYLGYDVVRHIETLGAPPPDDRELPDALFMFTDIVLAIDNVYGRALAITTVRTDDADRAGLETRYHDAGEHLAQFVARLDRTIGLAPIELTAPGAPHTFESNYPRAGFERDVERIRDYIAAGDAFQVVLSQRLSVPMRASTFDLYRALRSLNPSPYLYYLELDGITLVGSSPEVLVRVEDGKVILRPIAGTRPRGATDEEDAALAADLLADPKERAEHLMLVDLGRNDVGRVARFGSVHVPEFMAIERYSHVLHIVSQVEGDLRAGMSALDVLRACFPAGTVSGAPKIRAMQIIDELEPTRRGPYAGAVGHFAYGGRTMDTAIAIRTLVASGGRAWVQAGAGIVADSVPAREYEETLAKAGALLRVVQMLGGYTHENIEIRSAQPAPANR